MKIQLGDIYMDSMGNKTIYPNKTKKYLLPCLKEYGNEFISKINSVFKIACGIGDIVVEKSGLNYEKHLFILLDSSISNSFFIKFIDWIKLQSYYEDDYVYGSALKSTYHMIILKVPENLYGALDKFKLSEFSEMYSYEQRDKYFKNLPEQAKVLIKDSEYKLQFIEEVNKMFNTDITDFDKESYELDFPVKIKNEKFNI